MAGAGPILIFGGLAATVVGIVLSQKTEVAKVEADEGYDCDRALRRYRLALVNPEIEDEDLEETAEMLAACGFEKEARSVLKMTGKR